MTSCHAGMGDEERRANQDDFFYEQARVMVTTGEFAMSINKLNVSYTVHYNMPRASSAIIRRRDAPDATVRGRNACCSTR